MSELVMVRMARQNAEALVDTHPPGWRGSGRAEEVRRRQEGARAEITEALERPPENTFALSRADVKLLTHDLSDYGGSAEKAMEGMLALDGRMREWLGTLEPEKS